MKGIETRLEIHASPWTVYKAVTDPANFPRFVPGVEASEVLAVGLDRVGTLVDLTTRSRRHLEAVVTSEAKNHFFALQDARGTVYEWELKRTPGGTLATTRILGEFDEARAEALAAEARAKLHRFKDLLENGVRLA